MVFNGQDGHESVWVQGTGLSSLEREGGGSGHGRVCRATLPPSCGVLAGGAWGLALGRERQCVGGRGEAHEWGGCVHAPRHERHAATTGEAAMA